MGHNLLIVNMYVQFQIISGIFYISTYEGVRHELGKYDVSPKVKVNIYNLFGKYLIYCFRIQILLPQYIPRVVLEVTKA